MCFSLSTKYSFSIWKLFFLEFAKYRRLHLPVNAPQTLKSFPNVPTTSFLWNSPFKYLLIQNLHLLLWGSPRCFCGSQYASEGIFANLAHTFDSLGWENSETQTFDVIWNRVFTGIICLSGGDLSQRCCWWFLFKRMKENLIDCRWVLFSNSL